MSSGKFHEVFLLRIAYRDAQKWTVHMYFVINTTLRRYELESMKSELNYFDSNELLSNFTFNTENYFQSTFWTPAQNFFNCLTKVYLTQCMMLVELFF